ncbi:site-specific DNA-methyltransferase [Chitinophagaceae bacterium IBVUCB1]|nr:site-specific DNA-methyltransferase [Chitinophagaceae bacterium IBVUCB1]
MTDKLDMTTPDGANNNVKKIAALFPNCVTESAEGLVVDFDLLKQELNNYIVEGTKERYRLEWPGKKEAIVTANLPTTKTLRPVREDSVDFDNTENLYIEGDNLEVLKLLQESYLGKVKMIYIDPPYNTGKDFVYRDNFKQDSVEFKEQSGQTNEYSQRLVPNVETEGRYHSIWLTMMYPRLKLARNLLANDGMIFVSIDDHEAHNLKKMLDEIFGENNFISDITVVNNLKGRNDKKYIATANEKLFMYVKTDEFQEYGLSLPDDKLSTYNEGQDDQKYRLIELRKRGGPDTRAERPNMYFPIYVDPTSGTVSLNKSEIYSIEAIPKKSDGTAGRWRWGKDTVKQRIDLLIGKPVQGTNRYNIYEKDYLEQNGELRRIKPKSVMAGSAYSTDGATKKYRSIMGDINFTNPKPVEMLSDLIQYAAPPDTGAIFLDFFSGSGTTAHAVLELNANDNGNRRFIMVQVPESLQEDASSWQQGYKTICDIGKERIRRAAKKIKAETGAEIDYGFRVYRLDESNMQDVYYRPQDYKQENLELFADNVKPGRSGDDLLAQVMLDWGLPLSLKIEQLSIIDRTVFKVAENSLMACFDKDIDEAFAKEIAKYTPLRVVFRDSSFKNDTAKENVKQLLKQLSPETEMRVI